MAEGNGQLNVVPTLRVGSRNLARRLRASVTGRAHKYENKPQNKKIRTSHLCLASV
jgi:hypothetical protein